jgi:hypothetical protein
MEKMEWIERKSTEVVASSLVTGSAISQVVPTGNIIGLPSVGMTPFGASLIAAVPVQDWEKAANTLIGRDAFLVADAECRKGVIKLYEWEAAREAEIRAIYTNEEFLRKGADGITYNMLADTSYAAQILVALGVDPALATMSLVPPPPRPTTETSTSIAPTAPSAPPAGVVASEAVVSVIGAPLPPKGGGWGTLVLVGGATLLLGPAAIIPAAVAGFALQSKSTKVS